MHSNEKIYVTGHLNPDSDSIASAIGYAFFKRCKGIPAVACRLGALNPETKWLLDRFGFDAPLLLKDARKTLREIDLDEPSSVNEHATLYEVIQKMDQENRPAFGVVDDHGILKGMITRSDLARIGLGDTAFGIELLKHTSIEAMAKTVSGTVVYNDAETHINGKVSIIALTADRLENYEITDRIVIIGDDSEAQKQLIEKGAGALIVVWAKQIREDVLSCARLHHCPIILSGHGSMNTSRYLYFSPPVNLIMTTKMIRFEQNELAEDAGREMQKTRFRNYPVTDEQGRLIGYVSRYHIMNLLNRKIILVDHNEFSQSVRAIEKAQLLEVVDHHRINDFMTRQPVAFRSEIVGSTSTIIASMFRENQIPMPSNLAGLLLGAVLSDTLMLMSPTTTDKDITEANILAALADLDIDTFGKEMFEVSARHGDEPYSALYGSDLKYFEIRMKRIGITQIMVSDLQAIRKESEEIEKSLQEYTANRDTDLFLCAFTSIGEKGSVFYACGNLAGLITKLYPDKEGETHSIQHGILSRKAQILPDVSNLISEYY